MLRPVFLVFVFSSISLIGNSQEACPVYYTTSAEISNSTINGTVIVNPEGPININVNYVSPTDDTKYKLETFAYLLGFNKDPDFMKRSEQEKEKYILDKMRAFHDQQKIIKQEKRGIELAKKDLANTEQRLQEQINKQKEELARLVKQAQEARLSPVLENKLSEIKTQTNQIISSVENCLLSDFEPVSFKDVNTGEIIYAFSLEDIKKDPNYVLIDEYSEGLARVKRNNKFGFYNPEGQLSIPFKYDYAGSFHEGMTVVKNLGKWFFINANGKKILELPQKYQSADAIQWSFANIYQCKQHEKTFYLQILNKKFTRIEYIHEFSTSGIAKFFTVESSYPNEIKYGLINNKGHIVQAAIFDAINQKKAFNNFYLAKIKADRYGLIENYGLLNQKGEIVIPVEYWKISLNNYIWAKYFEATTHEKYKTDLYDYETGNLIVSSSDYYYKIKYKYILVEKDGKDGVLSLKGEEIFPCVYDFIEHGYDKQFIVKQKGKFGVINEKKEIIIPMNYDEISNSFTAAYQVTKKDKVGIISATGALILPIEYDELEVMDFLIKAKKDDKFTFFNLAGEVKLEGQSGTADFYIASIKKQRIKLYKGDKRYYMERFPEIYFLQILDAEGNTSLYVIKDRNGDIEAVKGEQDISGYDKITKLGKQVYLLHHDRYTSYSESRILYNIQMSDKYFELEEKNIHVDINQNIIINQAKKSSSYSAKAQSFILNPSLEKVVEYQASRNNILPCSNGMYLIETKKYNLEGVHTSKDYLDKYGQQVTNRQFDFAEPFHSSNTAIVGISDNKYGVIDHNGAEIIVLYFSKITRTKSGFSITTEQKETFEVDLQGKCLGANCDKYNEIIQLYYSNK
jgi:hypothetical protein